MISKKISTKLIKISTDLIDLVDAPRKHFSFILEGNRIWSIGWNSHSKTHPLAAKHGYWGGSVHSELSALVNYKRKIRTLSDCTMVNLRLSPTGTIMISKPCAKCQQLLAGFGVGEVIYSTDMGTFLAV